VNSPRERLLTLHKRVVAGDRVAPSELFATLQKPIARVLYGRFRERGITWEDAGDLATDAIVEYLGAAARFQPEKASLFTYLVMAANGDTLNLIRDRRREKENLDHVVELLAAGGNITDESDLRRLDAEKLLSGHIDDIVETEMERKVLKLMLQCERSTSAYAAVLGIQGLTELQQRREVKKIQDRIKVRLKRLGGRL
jgi:RNA polymerase sigma-70 factor (ECF subfamily)